MEKVLIIGGKEIGMKSTAGTMMRYRNQFNRDFIKDLVRLQEKLSNKIDTGADFEALDLDIFDKIAWCMAKTYNNDIPDIEHWLDEFETFDIMQVLPDIMGLLIANMEQVNENNKKKLETTENKSM